MPWYIHSLRRCYCNGAKAEISVVIHGTVYKRWVRAVCEPYTSGRLQAAWWVLRGKAVAFEYPKPGDFEQIAAME